MKRASIVTMAMTAGMLAACVDDPLQPPQANSDVTAVAGLSSSQAGKSFVVEFMGKGPENLSADVAELGGTVDYVVESLGFATVSGLSDDAAAALGARSGVGSVYEDIETFLAVEPMMGEMEALGVEQASIANPAGSFRFFQQWGMRRIGANVAWAAGLTGSPDVTIAILDTGIDYTSFDMNGMVDLDRSVSFVQSDNNFIATLLPGRHPIDDLNGHGSNVASQASSNATIYAGVNSRARLMGVKVLGRTGAGSLSGVLAGIAWAADNGADVANLSIGVPRGVNKRSNQGFVALTNRAMNYAHGKGMLVVVAAGNDTTNMDNDGLVFRAYCEAPHVICVSATGPTASTNAFNGPWTNEDAPAIYSNFGRQAVTVAAPGGTSRGWVPSTCPRFLAIVSENTVSFPCNLPPGFFITLGYAGTSQASPHVAGLAAQLIAKHGRRNPSQIKHLLLQGVDDLGAPGADPNYGAGRINVAKALGL